MKLPGLGQDTPITSDGLQSDIPYACHLWDPEVFLRVSAVLSKGASTYGEDSWRKLTCEDHINHMLVHVFAYLAGDKQDDHLDHAVCRAMFASATQEKPSNVSTTR